MPGLPQYMTIFSGKLIVGYPSGFRMWNFSDNSQQGNDNRQVLIGQFLISTSIFFLVLLNLEDSSLQFLNSAMYDAHLFVEVSDKEFLLIFQKFGVYVDSHGRRSRSHELMFPAMPTSFAFTAPYLSIYTASHVDVVNVSTAEWVQTLNIKSVINRLFFDRERPRWSLKFFVG